LTEKKFVTGSGSTFWITVASSWPLVTARPSGTSTLPPVAAWHGTSWVRESSCAVFGVPSALTP
jgi:hypothetical protein